MQLVRCCFIASAHLFFYKSFDLCCHFRLSTGTLFSSDQMFPYKYVFPRTRKFLLFQQLVNCRHLVSSASKIHNPKLQIVAVHHDIIIEIKAHVNVKYFLSRSSPYLVCQCAFTWSPPFDGSNAFYPKLAP